MAWPKGKPRLSDEERAAREQRRERTLYPAMWEHVGCYYCSYKINGPFVSGRDDAAFKAAGVLVQEHIKEADASGLHARAETRKRDTSFKRKGQGKAIVAKHAEHDEVLADAVETEAKVADKTLRERVSRGRI